MIIFKLYTSLATRRIAWVLLVLFLGELTFPTLLYGLTSGPSQPEAQSFEPIGTTQMVDLFTGDFTYNIPLFELPGPDGGYPFNLAYHAGIGMEQEASWVGLGWSLNPGAINRHVKGIPDEFQGEKIKVTQHLKPDQTFEVGAKSKKEFFGKSIPGNLSLSLGVRYNNYKGMGMSWGAGMQLPLFSHKSNVFELGASIGGDTNSGPNLSSGVSYGNEEQRINFGAQYSTRQGLYGWNLGYSQEVETKRKLSESVNLIDVHDVSIGSSFSLINKSFQPTISHPMNGFSINISQVSFGPEIKGFYGGMAFYGSYHNTWLRNNGKETNIPAYGYLYATQGINSGSVLSDLNQENVGVLDKQTPFLAIPNMTYDNYSVTGQGMAGAYRPYRSDVGTLSEQSVHSYTGGGDLGLQVGGSDDIKIGVDGALSYGESISEAWKYNTGLSAGYVNYGSEAYAFQSVRPNDILYEPYYFKATGESSTDASNELNYIGGDNPVRMDIQDYGKSNGKLSPKNSSVPITQTNSFNVSEQRESRNTVILPVKNSDIGNGTSTSEFYIEGYARDVHPEEHFAGYISTNTSGVRYVYGLPTYNTKQVECQFSVKAPDSYNPNRISIASKKDKPDYNIPRTDQYYNRTETPAYAHAYLLTSVLGTDYMDTDNILGPSDGDLGYWVKFTYEKKVENFKWRAPYVGANYSKGYHNLDSDDKASYVYGEKEVWYLKSVETKSHIAIFETSHREDGRGAVYEIQNKGDNLSTAARLQKLDNIKLYIKSTYQAQGASATPLTTIHLEYNYALCPDVENNLAGEGKLTLKKLWFTHEHSTRGSLTPYTFDYHENNPAENVPYNSYAQDRWGNYKPVLAGGILTNFDFPYVNQNENYGSRHQEAGMWSLKEITLPSGAHMEITYESDDYAYVQNKTATQMFKVQGFGQRGDNDLKKDDLKLFFELERPIPQGWTETQKIQELRRYVADFKSFDGRGQIYFSTRVELKDNAKDIVKGYAEFDLKAIQDATGLNDKLWVDNTKTIIIDGNPHHQYAFIKLSSAKQGIVEYNPIRVAAWQHLESNQPQIIYQKQISDSTPGVNDVIRFLSSLVTSFTQVYELFVGFHLYANTAGWGKSADLDYTYIRLASPDKVKYGGGHRVRQITLKDAWNTEEGSYGQVYEYQQTEQEDGEVYTISSGVAAYEPILGGDENALKYAYKYNKQYVVKSSQSRYTEFPLNEHLYPGASVGYSKVTVKSLASAHRAGDEVVNLEKDYFTDGLFSSTGSAVHEFYTAKDFPVKTDYTTMNRKSPRFSALQFLGINIQKMTATQGYVIELNDMHGKPKKATYYPQLKDGTIGDNPISWTQYKYHTQDNPVIINDKEAQQLNNHVPVQISKRTDAGCIPQETKLLGVDYDFFMSSAHHNDWNSTAGTEGNVDLISLIFPAVTVWPALNYNEYRVFTHVTNKVIFRKGILKAVTAYDGSSTMKTENQLWDSQTGEVLLTEVRNNFDAPVYSYTEPAYFYYDGMAAAYKNVGLRFIAPLSSGTASTFTINVPSAIIPHLVQGDEFLIGNGLGQGIIQNITGNTITLVTHKEITIPHLDILGKPIPISKPTTFYLYRSGRRNLLAAKVGQLVGLQNPLDCISVPTKSKRKVEIPPCNACEKPCEGECN